MALYMHGNFVVDVCQMVLLCVCGLSPQGEQIVFSNGKCSDVGAFIMLSLSFCMYLGICRALFSQKQSSYKAIFSQSNGKCKSTVDYVQITP
jgi:hypothetical protein